LFLSLLCFSFFLSGQTAATAEISSVLQSLTKRTQHLGQLVEKAISSV